MFALSGAARAAALSIEVAGISTRANSSIVAWQANDAARAGVEDGTTVAAGITLFMGSACTRGAQQLALLRGTAFSLRATREQRTNGGGLIGWYQQDEPDGHGRTSLPTLPASAKSRRVSFLTLTD